jgi:cell division protein FtsW
MTTLTHPVLRGRTDHGSRSVGRRRLVPGTATSASWLLLAVVTVLTMIGLVMVMSASSVVAVRSSGVPWSYFQRQIAWTLLGVVCMVAAASVSVDVWRRHARTLLLASIGLLVLVVVPGVGITANGATRWLGYGPVQIQPAELTKFALLLFVADLLDRRAHRIHDWRWGIVPVLAYLGLVAGLIMAQPNLGTLIIIATMVLAVLWAAGNPLGTLAAAAAALVAGAAAFVAFTPFRRARYLMFLDPMKDPYNEGLQNVQSMVALANGGLLGQGLGRSTAKWGYLPYAWTDFIFAVIGEELGMLGAMTVVVLFLVFGATGTYIASQARDRFSMLVAVGITVWLSVQAFMNIAAVVGLMPITGIPLPFISFGGSSMVVNLTAVGLLLNIARHPAVPAPARSGRAGR